MARFTPARISLCILSDDGLTSSVFQGLPANHVQVVVLVTSGRCWPSAADEEWYSPKRPSSTVAIQHSSGSSIQRWVTFFRLYASILSRQCSMTSTISPTYGKLPLSEHWLSTNMLHVLKNIEHQEKTTEVSEVWRPRRSLMGEVELCKLRCEKCGQLKVNWWRMELEGTPNPKDAPDKAYQPSCVQKIES